MRTLASLLFLFAAVPVFAGDRAVAVEYIKARCATLSRGAGVPDVEKVLTLMRDDAVIEHPKFGAVVKGKEAIRRGLVSHLSQYTGDADESGIVVLSELESPGAVAFKTRTTFVVGEGAARQVITREGLTIVELKDGRVSRLIEY